MINYTNFWNQIKSITDRGYEIGVSEQQITNLKAGLLYFKYNPKIIQ